MADKDMNQQLLDAQSEIVELKAKTKTTLTGMQFLTLFLIGPLFAAFVAMGLIIVFKTVQSPATIAPHLDIILLCFSIFSLPCTAAASAIMTLLSDEIKSKIRRDSNEE